MRRHTHLLGIAWFASIVGCQPYESKTAELGESGIRPVLIPSETSNEAPPEYTPPPRPDAAEWWCGCERGQNDVLETCRHRPAH